MADSGSLGTDVKRACQCLLVLVMFGHALVLSHMFAPRGDEKLFDESRRILREQHEWRKRNTGEAARVGVRMHQGET